MVESLIETVLTVLLYVGLPALFIVFVLRGAIIGKPLPATILLPGYVLAVSSSDIETAGIILVTAVGSTLGQLFVYTSARRQGLSFIESAPRVTISESKLRRVEKLFKQYGGVGIFLTNLIPYLRGFILIPAGIAEYPIGRVVVYTFVSTVVYHTVVVIVVIGAIRLFF